MNNTNFKKVIDFHKAFGLLINNKFDINILNDKKLVKLRLDLIKEEINELKDAIKDKNFTEIRDAIGDIIYVINGMGVSFGIDIDECYKDHFLKENNMSIFKHIKKVYKNTKVLTKEEVYKNISSVRILQKFVNVIEKNINIRDLHSIIKYTIHLLNQVYLLGYKYNIDVDSDYNLIHKSNMSKLCKTEDEAIETVLNYKKNYIINKSPYDTPDYRLSDDKHYYVVYNKSSGKILKSINYKPVDLSK